MYTITSRKVFPLIILSSIGIYTADSLSTHSQKIPEKRVESPLHTTAKIQKNFGWNLHFSARNFYTASDRSVLENTKKAIKKAYISLPTEHRKNLQKIEIRNQDHVSRGMANAKKMIIHTGRIKSQDELRSVFVHEMGHVYDLGGLQGDPKYGTSEFTDGKKPIYKNDPSLEFYRISWQSAEKKRPSARSKDFVSGYAKSDVFEDFAESYIFYRLHGEKFRSLAQKSLALKQKYQFLKTQVFDYQEFQTEKNEIAPAKQVWDATLL